MLEVIPTDVSYYYLKNYLLKPKKFSLIILSSSSSFQINSFIKNCLKLNFKESLIFEFDDLISYWSLINGAMRHFHERNCLPRPLLSSLHLAWVYSLSIWEKLNIFHSNKKGVELGFIGSFLCSLEFLMLLKLSSKANL